MKLAVAEADGNPGIRNREKSNLCFYRISILEPLPKEEKEKEKEEEEAEVFPSLIEAEV